MSRFGFAGVAAVSLAALLAGSAMAQTSAPQGPAAARQARLDPDADGKISQAEFVQARTARLTALDTDRDGQVTAAERQAGRQAMRATRAAARFDRLDADKNGEISRSEFDSARTARAEAPRQARRGDGRRAQRMHNARPGGARWAQRAERRMNRTPGRASETRPAAVVIADVQTRAAANFTRLDKDNDGFLTAPEVMGRRAMAGHRMGRAAHRMGAGRMAPPRMAQRMNRPMHRQMHAPAVTPSPSAPASE
ncbi:hypothetical protein KOAAANKH_00431 [Brevundimonas sp. NIBR10]|uniref:hypothetical protein n=1 Tax=Brevundimonas sp. NIBR10 TaxID=3015997 RepID=UPI0022F18DA6|nr:hypothetical protein [Brevundimonas sp. NIBR10]WGM45568.1 hypothetical protein KOAAANKH_00431 [Brevundimonas sp. NIBR10]